MTVAISVQILLQQHDGLPAAVLRLHADFFMHVLVFLRIHSNDLAVHVGLHSRIPSVRSCGVLCSVGWDQQGGVWLPHMV